MTRKVSLTAALVALVLMPWAFATGAAAPQAIADQSRATAAPVAQRNEPGASTTSVDAYVRLFENADTSGDIVCTIPITSAPYSEQINLQKHSYGCKNDEAVSISFSKIPAGSTISLYDDPKCSEGDDWVKFTFLSEVSWTYAHRFEFNEEKKQDGHVVFTQVYHRKNNLDGKVSCVDIHVPEPH